MRIWKFLLTMYLVFNHGFIASQAFAQSPETNTTLVVPLVPAGENPSPSMSTSGIVAMVVILPLWAFGSCVICCLYCICRDYHQECPAFQLPWRRPHRPQPITVADISRARGIHSSRGTSAASPPPLVRPFPTHFHPGNSMAMAPAAAIVSPFAGFGGCSTSNGVQTEGYVQNHIANPTVTQTVELTDRFATDLP